MPKVVRIETKIAMKDDYVELPSNFTKRCMYARWCLDRGWVAKARGGNGSYGRIAKYETRKTAQIGHLIQYLCLYVASTHSSVIGRRTFPPSRSRTAHMILVARAICLRDS